MYPMQNTQILSGGMRTQKEYELNVMKDMNLNTLMPLLYVIMEAGHQFQFVRVSIWAVVKYFLQV